MKDEEQWKKLFQKDIARGGFEPVKIIGKNGFTELIEEVQKHLKNNMKVLDVGCGIGHVLLNIYRTTNKKVKMIGIDQSPSRLKIAKMRSKGIKDIYFLLMDAYKTKFRNNLFDIIINRLGPRSYDEIYRILKKKGLFFLFVTDKEDWREVRKHFGFKEYVGLKEQVEMLRKAGFKIIAIKKFSYIEFYRDLESFVKMLEIQPFAPTFSRRKHSKLLKEYENKYRTNFGIISSHKRSLIISIKQ